jgi:FkbM family methyltransferase
VVAFEPGYASFKNLCDNVGHNQCQGRVVPLPMALGARTGLFELEYAHAAGDDLHTLTHRHWRAHRDHGTEAPRQPVCAETLDDVVARHALPPPAAIRLAVRRHAPHVLEGASRVLALPGLRAVLCCVRSAEQAEAVTDALRPFGFSAAPSVDEGDHGLAVGLARTAPAPGRSLRTRGSRLWSRARQG